MIDDAAKKQYQQNGFLLVKNLFQPEAIDQVVTHTQRLFNAKNLIDNASFDELVIHRFNNDFNHFHGAAKIANHQLELYQLGLSNDLLACIKHLGLQTPTFAARPLMWFHSPSVASTPRYAALPAHQEWSNMQGSLNGLVAWLPLQKISQDMGRLQVIPSSHRRGLLPFLAKDEHDYPFSIPGQYIDDSAFVEIDAEVGDCLLFSAFLIHRSGINNSNKIRLTCNFRFNDAHCKNFIARDFIDPFHYAAADKLKHDYWPSAEELQQLFDQELP